MTTVDILFNFSVMDEDAEFDMLDYLRALSGNNQIIFETINISGSEDRRTVRAAMPYSDSLDSKYNNKFVREAYERLRKHLVKDAEVQVIGENYTYNDCFSTGSKADFYYLHIHHFLSDVSPIRCAHCDGNIPFYLLPQLSDELLNELLSWRDNYSAYDRLFNVSDVGEMSAHKMLSNVTSTLNQRGIALCRSLEPEFKKPVYFYLYRFYGKNPKKCPICGGDWKQPKNSLFDYKCDKCKLVADKAVSEK